MEKNKNLEQVLQYLPKTTIKYKQKSCVPMNVPYTLTVIGYKRIFLNEFELDELTPEEQLILLHSNNSDPTYTPSSTLAGIFKAREIMKRSENRDDAIINCNKILLKVNQAHFKKRSSIRAQISEKTMHANLLEYYLDAKKALKEYDKQQASRLAPIINFKNKFLGFITRKPHGTPPYSRDELERGKKAWEKFRAEQNADDSVSNKELLRRYRYNANYKTGEPFEFLYNNPELSAISEDYATTNIALQILDGSAFQKAEAALNRNPHQYIKRVKTLNSEKSKEI